MLKISCDLSKKYFECFDEAKGIALHKRKILKNKSVSCLSYMQEVFLIFLVIEFICLLLSLVASYSMCFFIYFLLTVDIIFFLFHIIRVFVGILLRKKQGFKGSIIIDENGITNTSYYKIKMVFAWPKIKAIVIKKYTVTILTDTPCYFYFDVAKNKKILEAVKKYHKNTLILENEKE